MHSNKAEVQKIIEQWLTRAKDKVLRSKVVLSSKNTINEASTTRNTINEASISRNTFNKALTSRNPLWEPQDLAVGEWV